jgi:glutamine synthetase
VDRQKEYVLRTVEERGVRFVRLWFTDVLGQLKSFAISPAELENAFEDGMQFDGSAIDGFSRIQESDVLARPDAGTFEILPWDAKGETSARMFCDLTTLAGQPFHGDPRQVLRRNLDGARERGYAFFVAPEVEFFYFRDGDPTQPLVPLDTGSYFDLTSADVSSDLRRRTIHHLEALGIPVEYSFHEDSPSQHEIDLRHTDALTMADNVMTLRLVVRETALDQGVHATFMPKPMAGVQGSGMHTHLSLFEGDGNAFHDPEEPYLLSKVGRAFVAGLLHHATEITAVTNQLVNSYKRLIVGTEAPSSVTWARNHRAALVRVPETRVGKEEAVRIEYRSPDPACNPYLAYSLLLAAGLKGIDEGYELPGEATDYLELSPREQARSRAPAEELPQSLAGQFVALVDALEAGRE